MHLLFRFGTVVTAWLGSAIGLVLVLPLGLIVIEWLILPLALVIAGLLAALSAGWAGIFLARDQSQTRLWPVIGLTEAMAVGVALCFLSLVRWGVADFGPLIVPAIIFSLVLTLTATLATWRFRRSKQSLSSEIKLTVTLLALAVVSVPAVIFLASLFGLAGA
jgi:hypothetical protein